MKTSRIAARISRENFDLFIALMIALKRAPQGQLNHQRRW
jgi:hypothetical protein